MGLEEEKQEMKETIDEGMMQDVHDDTEYVRPQMEHGTQNISSLLCIGRILVGRDKESTTVGFLEGQGGNIEKRRTHLCSRKFLQTGDRMAHRG
jgi:hypothetical protein